MPAFQLFVGFRPTLDGLGAAGPPDNRMQYFYDHQTDAVSFILAEFRDYSDAEEIVPGVILYLDRSRAVAVDIRGATKILDTRGLIPLYARTITAEEIARRMAITDAGQNAWKLVQSRMNGNAPKP